jgi:TRAP-type C4-dicarboxylate transport system permease small subunit
MSTPSPATGLRRGLQVLHRLEDGLLALLLGAMILVAAAQILLRNLFDWNFSWGDPFTRILVLWVGLLGALAASRGNRHISVDLLSHLLRDRAKAAVNACTGLFTAGVCAVVTWHAARFVLAEMDSASRGLWNLPLWLFQSIIPLGFGLIGLRFLLLALSEAQRAMRGDTA